MKKCVECGGTKFITKKCSSFGKCSNCNHKQYVKNYYKQYVRPKQICSICGETKVIKEIVDDKLICSSCYNPPKEQCFKCGENSFIWSKNNGKPLCQKCYKRPLHKCTICGDIRIIKKTDGEVRFCQKCLHNHRYNTDSDYRIRCILRSRFINAIKSKKKKISQYGIDYGAIIKHLGPCPGKRGDYHIDHIFPLSAFDLNCEEQIKLAFAPENHQWLKKKDNLSKNAKYNKDELNEFTRKYKCQKK